MLYLFQGLSTSVTIRKNEDFSDPHSTSNRTPLNTPPFRLLSLLWVKNNKLLCMYSYEYLQAWSQLTCTSNPDWEQDDGASGTISKHSSSGLVWHDHTCQLLLAVIPTATGPCCKVYSGRAVKLERYCVSRLHVQNLLWKHSFWDLNLTWMVLFIRNPTSSMVWASGSAVLKARPCLLPKNQFFCRRHDLLNRIDSPPRPYREFGESRPS